eukprot:469845_1
MFKFRTTTGQGWGITTDGKYLILYKTSVQHPLSGKPLRLLNDLQFARGLIFANVWTSEVIYAIDPKTGEVQAYYDMAELYPRAKRSIMELNDVDAVLNGIAYRPDEDTFYLTGKRWPYMWKVHLFDPERKKLY